MYKYSWIGIDLYGNTHKGQSWARSEEHLSNLLVDLEIGLVKARFSLVNKNKVSYKQKIGIVSHLVSLLKSDIKINQALVIIKDCCSNNYLKLVLDDIKSLIESGESISSAFSRHKNTFDQFFCSLMLAGESTGNLAKSLEYFVSYSQNIINFRKKVKRLLITPVITFFIFMLIALSLFLFIVPRFNDIFLSFNKPLPKSTYFILKVSTLLNSKYILVLALLVLFLLLLLSIFLRKAKLNKTKEALFFKVSGVGSLYRLIYKAIFLQMLNVLLKGKVNLINALETIADAIGNDLVASEVKSISSNLKLGHNFSKSLELSNILSNKEIIEIISIGESSGDISNVVNYLADHYTMQVYSILSYFSNIVQPLILIFLGLLIASIILALYIPIFTLSNVVS